MAIFHPSNLGHPVPKTKSERFFPSIHGEERGVQNSKGTVSFPKQAAQARVKEVEKGEVREEEEKEDKERQEAWRGEGEEEEDRLRRTRRKGSRNGRRRVFWCWARNRDAPLFSKGSDFIISREPCEHKQPQPGKCRL